MSVQVQRMNVVTCISELESVTAPLVHTDTRSAVPSQRNGTSAGLGIERRDPKDVTRQREAAGLRCAGIEDMEQHALTLPYANGFAMPKHLPLIPNN